MFPSFSYNTFLLPLFDQSWLGTLSKSDISIADPRTPTPFKDALAAIERRSGASATMPSTPSRLDALTEIIRQETDRESAETSSGAFQDSGYGTGRRRGKENSDPDGKRVRKALCQAWSSSQDNSDLSFAVETPVSRNYLHLFTYLSSHPSEQFHLENVFKKSLKFLWQMHFENIFEPTSNHLRIGK